MNEQLASDVRQQTELTYWPERFEFGTAGCNVGAALRQLSLPRQDHVRHLSSSILTG